MFTWVGKGQRVPLISIRKQSSISRICQKHEGVEALSLSTAHHSLWETQLLTQPIACKASMGVDAGVHQIACIRRPPVCFVEVCILHCLQIKAVSRPVEQETIVTVCRDSLHFLGIGKSILWEPKPACVHGTPRAAAGQQRVALLPMSGSGRCTGSPNPLWWSAVRISAGSRPQRTCQKQQTATHARGQPRQAGQGTSSFHCY